jgi:hypothetical protein
MMYNAVAVPPPGVSRSLVTPAPRAPRVLVAASGALTRSLNTGVTTRMEPRSIVTTVTTVT